MLLSVVNALTLSPALAAMLLKPATGKKSLLTPFYNGFNRVFGWTTDRYVSFAGILARKMFRSLAFIGILCYVTFMLVQRIPGGFVPEEDQGYILVNALLPDAASLERTDAVMRKAEAILEKNEAVEGFNTITGYSLLTGAYSSNMGFFFVQLKPWEERTTEESHANGVVAALNRAFAQGIPEAGVVAVRAPGDPRTRHRRRVHDGAAGSQRRIAGLPGAAGLRASWRRRRKRPEIGRINSLYRATVPQIFADIDREQGPQVGRAAERREHDARGAARQLLHQRLQPLRPCLQGVRAGRAGVPPGSEAARAVLRRRTQKGGMVPLDTLVTTGPSNGPEFTNRFNLFRDGRAHGSAGRGVLVDAGARCPRGDGARGAAAGRDLRLGRPVVPGTPGPWRGHGVRAGDLPRVPHPGGAVRELGSAVQRAARHAVRRVRRVSRSLPGAAVPGRRAT